MAQQATIRPVSPRRGPSVKKARAPELLERAGPFVRTTEGRWRDLFAHADAMSEGAVKDEAGALVYYGTTSLILGLPVETPVDERAFLRDLAAKDVHAHVHAVRCAHREAQSRVPGMLGRAACELRFSEDPRGLRIDVDVQAPLIERRKITRTGP